MVVNENTVNACLAKMLEVDEHETRRLCSRGSTDTFLSGPILILLVIKETDNQ